jgi:BMFP domain-containing protein YqiC
VEQEKLEQRLAELEAKLAQAGEKPTPPADPPASDG